MFFNESTISYMYKEYKAGLEIVHNLKIVNDTAERGVKLMSDYNDILTVN